MVEIRLVQTRSKELDFFQQVKEICFQDVSEEEKIHALQKMMQAFFNLNDSLSYF